MFVDLQIPPGVVRNGTDRQSSGRWRDASLVRWNDNAMQPVGGWRERADFTSGKYRGSIAWAENAGDRWIAVGDYQSLKVATPAGVVSDITPAGFTSGSVNATQNNGFGGGAFGVGTFGTPRQSTTRDFATSWSLSTWGEYLIACSDSDGKIYEWQLNTGTPAAVLSNAPTNCSAAIVTPERFLMALGAGGDPRKVQWSDREDNNTWTAAATNEAGDFTLDGSGSIMCGFNVSGETLIVTDTEAWAADYVGPPFVYGFRKVGLACGIASRKAIAPLDVGAVWMGDKSFFIYQGGSVQQLPCDVWDYIFDNINEAQISKCHAVANSLFGEVWFFFPANAEGEISNYVSFNYRSGAWSCGALVRTTGVDKGAFDNPVWLGDDAVAYDHETGFTYDGGSIYAESGPIGLGPDASSVTAQELHPDEMTAGDCTVTFKTRQYPNGSESEYGPYTAATPTNVRFTGRQIRVRVDGSAMTSWRWGVPRLRVAARGRR